jgi:hypothetical protein
MPCRLEPLHLVAGRVGLTPLPAPEKARTLLLDHRGPGGARQAEGDARPRPYPNTASGQRASVPLRHCNHSSGQRRRRGRANGGRARPAGPAAGVLHQRSLVRAQGALPASPEAALCSGPRAAEAPPLLRGSPGHGGFLLFVGRNHPEPGRSRQDCQVVGGVDGRGAFLRTAQGNQVPDLGGFRRASGRTCSYRRRGSKPSAGLFTSTGR